MIQTPRAWNPNNNIINVNNIFIYERHEQSEGSTQKTTTINNARERYKIVTLPLEQSNINEKNTSKLHTLDLNKNSVIGHFKTRDIQFCT